MIIDKKIIDRIKLIEWCSNCGSTINTKFVYDNKYVKTWDEAKEYYTDISWENKALDKRNELSSFLFFKHKSEYSKWGAIVEEAVKFIDEEIIDKIKKIEKNNNLGIEFINCIKWDITGAILESEYKKNINIPIFYLSLLEIYESGNFPCGWNNDEEEIMMIF